MHLHLIATILSIIQDQIIILDLKIDFILWQRMGSNDNLTFIIHKWNHSTLNIVCALKHKNNALHSVCVGIQFKWVQFIWNWLYLMSVAATSKLLFRVATKIFEGFGEALCKVLILGQEPVSTIHYTRPGTCINRRLH